MKHYEILKSELDEVEKELKDLNKKKVALLQKIDECPLIYEIWHEDYDGSKSCRLTKQSLKYRYMNKEKAYIKLDELNDGCNYGRPYYMKIRELDG